MTGDSKAALSDILGQLFAADTAHSVKLNRVGTRLLHKDDGLPVPRQLCTNSLPMSSAGNSIRVHAYLAPFASMLRPTSTCLAQRSKVPSTEHSQLPTMSFSLTVTFSPLRLASSASLRFVADVNEYSNSRVPRCTSAPGPRDSFVMVIGYGKCPGRWRGVVSSLIFLCARLPCGRV